MTSASFNYFQRIDLTVKGYIDGAVATKTLKFVSQALVESTSGSDYWPILMNIGDITLSAGEFIPSSAFGGFTVMNDIGKFGANRKLSDLFQRYSPVDQTVTFYLAEVPNDTDTVSSWNQLGTGICSRWNQSIRTGENTIDFEVSGYRLPETVVTLEINRSIQGMTNAPDASLGRAVPLVLGYNDFCVPVRITADDAVPAVYAINTCYALHLKADISSPQVWVRDDESDSWRAIGSTGYDTTGLTDTGSYTLNTYSARAIEIGSLRGLFYGVRFVCQANGGGSHSSTALLNFFVLRYDTTTFDPQEVARGRVNLATYNTQNNGGVDFNITLGFDEPFLAYGGDDVRYALGWSVTGYTVNDLSLNRLSSTVVEFRKDSAENSNAWKYVTNSIDATGGFELEAKLLSYTQTYSSNNFLYESQSGLTYSFLTLSAATAVDSGQTTPAPNSLPLLVYNVPGMLDFSGGTHYSAPHEVVDRLSYNWNGTVFADSGLWDTARYADAYEELYVQDLAKDVRQRVVSGVIDQRVTYAELLAEICRTSASRVGLLSNGKLFMYPWGLRQDAAAKIPPADITPISWNGEGIETVVNRVTINMGRNYGIFGNYFDNAVSEGRTTAGYSYSNDFSAQNFATVAALTEQSRALYGDRPNAEVNFTLRAQGVDGFAGYLASSSSLTEGYGSFLAEYYLTRFGLPAVYAEFIVPYHRYSTLEMFDVVKISHPSFPAFHGTDSEAPLPVYESGGVVGRADLIKGHEWVRAQTYRGLIESKTYILPTDQAPAIRLRVLVLLNTKDPT